MAGTGVKILCGQEGDVCKSKEKTGAHGKEVKLPFIAPELTV
jgi:hypothetical protein